MADVIKIGLPDKRKIAIKDAVVRKLIPSGTDVSNPLVNLGQLGSAVATNSANFLGTYNYYPTISNTQPDSPTDVSNTTIASRLAEVISDTPTNNDYVFVSINYSTTIDEDEFRRFKYKEETDEWRYEFSIRNAAFSQAQWDAINSGINSTKVDNYDNHKADSVAIAPAYSASSAYAVGTNVTYKGKRYKCNTAIGGGGEAWNAAHWTEESIETALGDKADTADLGRTLNIVVPVSAGSSGFFHINSDITITTENGDIYKWQQVSSQTKFFVNGREQHIYPSDSNLTIMPSFLISITCKTVRVQFTPYDSIAAGINFNGTSMAYESPFYETFTMSRDTNWLTIYNLFCLSPDTHIATPNGYKKLCNLRNGDLVLSMDGTGNLCEDEVIETDAGEPPKYGDTLDIWRFSDGTEIKTIHPHEFYSADEEKFKYIADFAIGERVVLKDGSTAALKSHEQEQGKFQHMTLFTKKNNTYFANGILTGNRQSVKISKEW